MTKITSAEKILKVTLTLSALILYSGCSSSQSFIYNDEVELVRGNQNASIETALPLKKGHPRATFSYQGALIKPDTLITSDTLEEKNTLTTISSTLRQSRHSISGSFTFPFHDYIAAGINIDLSFNSKSQDDAESILNKHIFETSLFFTLSGTINRFTIAYKPQLTYLSVNGIYTRSYSTINDRESQITERTFTLRNSLAIRVDISKHFDLFAGAQHSIQPYKFINDKLQMENGYALYSGVGAKINDHLATDLFILCPLKTDITSYRAPIQTGIKISTTF